MKTDKYDIYLLKICLPFNINIILVIYIFLITHWFFHINILIN